VHLNYSGKEGCQKPFHGEDLSETMPDTKEGIYAVRDID